MSTAQKELMSSAFQNQPARGAVALPARPQPVKPSKPPVEQVRQAPRPSRNHLQNLWLTLMVLTALLCVGLGLFYLSSYASLAREAYRRVKLLGELRTEQEKCAQYQQIKAQRYSSDSIERQALRLHMVPADETRTVTLGR